MLRLQQLPGARRERRITLDPVKFQTPRHVVAVEPATLDRLTGRYKLGSLDVQVVRAGSLLFVIAQGRPIALRPLSETEFFIESRPSRIRFDAGADGKIARLEYQEAEGVEWEKGERVE